MSAAMIAQLMLPWKRDERDGRFTGWYLHLGTEHVITIAQLVDGWQWKWERGPTLTIGEERGFASFEACMQALWHFVFAESDTYYALLREHAVCMHEPLRQRYNAVVSERDVLQRRLEVFEEKLKLYDGELLILMCEGIDELETHPVQLKRCNKVIASYDRATLLAQAKEQGWQLDPDLCAEHRPKVTSA